MNKYLEKIALHQEPIGEILEDHNENYYRIEDSIDEHTDDMDHIVSMYRGVAPVDPHRDIIIDGIRKMREDRLREDLDIDGQHHENNVHTAKRLMALRDMAHLVNDDNAHVIVQRFEQAMDSGSGNPSSVWKGLGTAAATLGGGILGAAVARNNMGNSPWVLGGALAGAAVGGKFGHSMLGNALDDKIKDREELNYHAREDAIDNAYTRLHSRLTPV